MPDAFEVLGVRPAFDLDRTEIEAAYLPRAAALHPDVASDEEAARRMSQINMAKAILEDPETRAGVLLCRLGGPSAEEEKTLPPGFLFEILEVREQVEAAMKEPSPERRRALSHQWSSWSQGERERAISEVGAMFGSIPSGEPARSKMLRDIRIRLNAWRYVERLIEQLHGA